MLISISGIDGCGKTMQVEMLFDWFRSRNRKVIISKAYNEIAKIACRPFVESWTDDTAIMFLFQALHAQQYATAVEALESGFVVIADRWDESYLAYHQNFGPLSSQANLRSKLNEVAFHGKIPDFGFIIEVPPSVARHRRSLRGKVERFENRSDEYYECIQKAYRSIAIERQWMILDGLQTPQSIHQKITTSLGLKIRE